MKKSRLWMGGIACLMLLGAGCTARRAAYVPTPQPVPEKQVADISTVKLGWMGPLTGGAASYGESIKKGVELAKKDLGLDSVTMIFEDSQCDGKASANSINKLVAADQVQAIIGEVCSGGTLAAAPVAEINHVVMVSAASTAPTLSDAGDYIFRVVPSDALQGDFGSRLIAQKGYKKLAVLYGNEDYGVGFNEVLKNIFPTLGGQIVASEAFEPKSVDLKTQLTKIKNAGPDAIYIISNSPESAAAALKQIKELGLDVAVFGSEGLKSDDILKGAQGGAEGMMVTSVSGGTPAFMEKHKAAYGTDPGPFAAQGYDAMMAVGLALQNGARTGEEIKNALYNIAFDGASGHISFDAKGDVGGVYDVFVVKDGKFVAE